MRRRGVFTARGAAPGDSFRAMIKAASPERKDATTKGANKPQPATAPASTGPMIKPILLALESRASVLTRNCGDVWSAA